mmetsp:Transcript_88614/g.228543  ORF Transcript_88614/g.228543 Transcript_88614/m.228543 type:complete len:284 (+) Transcript_88614:1469-2320(+)
MATALRSSFSLSYLSTSRYCMSKRSSSACLSSSSSDASSSVLPCLRPASARRRRVSAASRCFLMNDTKSFNGSFPAVWFRTNRVECVSMPAVGIFTPSTTLSRTSTFCTGGRTSSGARTFLSCKRPTMAIMFSRVCMLAATSRSDWTPFKTSFLEMSGWHEPVTLTVTGSKSNCAMLNWSSVCAVPCLDGLKFRTICVEPSAGITPVSGEIVKSGCSSMTTISYSNWIGILQDSGMVLDLDVPMATRPKSTIRGNVMSLADGYAWMGTMRFSESSPQWILIVS